MGPRGRTLGVLVVGSRRAEESPPPKPEPRCIGWSTAALTPTFRLPGLSPAAWLYHNSEAIKAKAYLSDSANGLQLVFVLLKGHAHQLAARAHAGLLKQALQDGFHVAFGNL